MKKISFLGLIFCSLLAAVKTNGQSFGNDGEPVIQSNPDHSAFYAYAENNIVIMRWGTGNEREVDHYVTEHSTDGVHFDPMHQVVAKGAIDEDSSYEDADAFSGSTGTVSVTTPEGTVSAPGFTFLPAPSISPATDSALCQGDSLLLSSSASNNNQWYNGANPISGDTSQTLWVKTPGAYSVATIVDGFVSSFSQRFTIVFYPLPEQPVITWNADSSLVSSSTSGNQWYIDTTTAIPDAQAQLYKPDSSANYSVRVTQDGCSSPFSDLYAYIVPMTAVTSDTGYQVHISPNPATDFIRLSFGGPATEVVTARIFDFSGRLILEESNLHSGDMISIVSLTKGAYTLKVTSSDGRINSAIIFTKL